MEPNLGFMWKTSPYENCGEKIIDITFFYELYRVQVEKRSEEPFLSFLFP